MNQSQSPQAPAWGNYYQEAGQQTPNGATQWQAGQPYQMQQWNVVAPQAPSQSYQYSVPHYQTPYPYWTPQEAGGNQQGYQQMPQWQPRDVVINMQDYEAQLAGEDGYGPAGFDISVGGLLFAIFVACFLVWFGWRRKIQAVDEPSGVPVTHNDRRMLSLAEALNKLE